MEKRKKSVQFSLDVFDERETRCGTPCTCGIPDSAFSDLRFLLPLSMCLVHIQGVVSAYSTKQEIGHYVGIVVGSVLFPHFGRNQKPRWVGGGTLLTAASCFFIAFKTSLETADLWFLDFFATFLNGVGLVLSISLGSAYYDRNFPKYLPFIIGIGGSVKTAGHLVIMQNPSMWLCFGLLATFVAIPIAFVPKVVNSVMSNYGNVTIVNPTDDPSVIQELKNAMVSLFKSKIIMYNVLASVFFFLGLNLLCHERMTISVEAIGFLVSGWFLQFVKPRGKILIGVNIVVALGIGVYSITNAFLCRCNFLSFTIFSIFFFLSCLGRIGRFLFCIRSVERNDQPIALGTCFGIISLFLIPKILLIDFTCHCDGYTPFDAMYSSPCSTHCCQNNFIPNLVGAGFSLAGVIFDFLLFRQEDMEIYIS